MTSVLQVSGLRVEFPTSRGPFKAVDDVSFAVSPGERLGLIGESGSGKSTIALSLMRLIKPPGRIASAIRTRSRMITADEPTSAVDVVGQRRVMQTVRRVAGELGASVILIGHDMGLMAQFAQRVAVMRYGRIVEIGEVRQIFAQP